jgi:phage terminase large subunit-like protein
MKFIDDVVNGNLLLGKYATLAVHRHLNDLKRKDFDYFYSEPHANRAYAFISALKHTKGEYAGKRFNIQPFQEFFIKVLFGWQRKQGGRRFRKAYLEISRKNGKTELAAAIAVYCFLMDNETGAEIYTAATTRDQAKICFETARVFLKNLKNDSKAIDGMVTLLKHNFHVGTTNTKFESVSSDADTLDGLNPHCAIIDEYHAHKTSDVLEVMETGMGSRTQPLLLITTTAGFNRESPCFNYRKVLIDVLEGRKQDESVFPLLFCLDENDDWQDKKNWTKSNPNLGITPYHEYMEDQFNKAVNEGASKQIQFLTKNLNVWTTTSSVWISQQYIERSRLFLPESALEGKLCYGGLDLASTRDICAFVLIFPIQNGLDKPYVKSYFFCPDDNIRERSIADGVPYAQWQEDGSLQMTEGNVTDYDFIRAKIISLANIYRIECVAFDRWNASQLVIQLTNDGANMKPFGQGFISMSAPTKEVEKLFLSTEINHDGNPVMEWMINNVMLRFDPAGNIKIDKAKSTEKVDGAVAMVMAYSQIMLNESSGTLYGSDDRNEGLLIL